MPARAARPATGAGGLAGNREVLMASLGEAAYVAYCEHCGGKSIRGESLPSWDLQLPQIREHWEAAAEGVLAELTQYER